MKAVEDGMVKGCMLLGIGAVESIHVMMREGIKDDQPVRDCNFWFVLLHQLVA